MAYDGDEEAASAHFAAFSLDPEQPIGVATLHRRGMTGKPRPSDLQLRGMAVDETHRGRGIGRLLLEACRRHAAEAGAERIWCNARLPALPFYRANGFEQVSDTYEVQGLGPHVLMVCETGAAGGE